MLAYEEDAKRHYGNFLLDATELLENKNVKLERIKLLWLCNGGEMSSEANKAESIISFLIAICGTQGPYNYGNLLSLLNKLCGDEGKVLVANYEEVLTCKLNPRLIPVGKKFQVKIDTKLIKDVILYFHKTLAKLFKCEPKEFILRDVSDGCIELIYIISSDIAEKIVHNIQDEDFEHAKIVEIWIER